MSWIKRQMKKFWWKPTFQIRRDWANWFRPHRRLLRGQMNRGAYYSISSLLDNAHMRMEMFATPSVAATIDNGMLHMLTKELGDSLLASETMEGFGAKRLDDRVLGVLLNFTGIHSVEAIIGFSDDREFRELVASYFRDSLRAYEEAGDDGELTADDSDGTLTAFGYSLAA